MTKKKIHERKSFSGFSVSISHLELRRTSRRDVALAKLLLNDVVPALLRPLVAGLFVRVRVRVVSTKVESLRIFDAGERESVAAVQDLTLYLHRSTARRPRTHRCAVGAAAAAAAAARP